MNQIENYPENLKLHKLRGINTVELIGIGKINVLIGKNNSGKTNVLDCIHSSKLRVVGLTLNDQNITTIANIIEVNVKVKYPPNHAVMCEYWYDKAFRELLKTKKVIYLDEYVSVNNDLNIFFRSTKNAKAISVQNRMTQEIYTKFFDKLINPNSLFINSDRTFENRTGYSAKSDHLASKVFHLKNQITGSDNYKLFRKIEKEFKQLTGKRFQVISGQDSVLRVKIESGKHWVNIEDCGLGMQDIFFMVVKILTSEEDTVLLEEPETHIHADFQKRLLRFLKSVDKTFFLTTHSEELIYPEIVDKLFYCYYDQEVKVSDKTTHSKIISDLGKSHFSQLSSDYTILCEGITDVKVLKWILKPTNLLEDYKINFWPLCGDMMHLIDLSIFEGLKCTAIIDLDPKSATSRNKFKRNCNKHKIKYLQLSRYSIENYFTLPAIKSTFPEIKKLSAIQPDVKVDDQLGFSAKKKTVKSKVDSILEKMTIDDVKGTDLYKYLMKLNQLIRQDKVES